MIWLMADFGLAPVGLRLLPILSGRRVHVSLHDDLQATARSEGCSVDFIKEVGAFVSGLGRIGASADAVSEELLAEILPHASRTAIATLPVDSHKCVPAFIGPSLHGPLTIGFSGNFFGEQEFECFVEGLRRWSRRSRRDWRMITFGDPTLCRLDSSIDSRGFTPPDQVRAALSGCDLLLLPSPLNRPEMRSSMPTKLVSYLELGRMIFTFAPEKSATERVLNESHLGPVVSVCDPALVEHRLIELDAWDIQAAEAGWRGLVENRFNESRILHDLKLATG